MPDAIEEHKMRIVPVQESTESSLDAASDTESVAALDDAAQPLRPREAQQPPLPATRTIFRAARAALQELLWQVLTLSWKSCVTVWRRKLWAVGFVIVPFLIVIALGATGDALAKQVYPPDGGVTLKLDRCTTFNVYSQIDGSKPCTTIGFAPSSTESKNIMKRVASELGFSRGSKVGAYDIVEFSTVAALSRALLKYPGRVESGIAFTDVDESAKKYGYELWYNRTALEAYSSLRIDQLGGYYKIAGRTLALQQAVDAAIVAYASGKSGSANFEATVDSFPHKLAANFMDVIGEPSALPWLGPTFVVIGFAVQALMVIGLIVGEKESGVLFTIRRMGLIEMAHWLSWFLTFAFLCAISSALVILGGSVYDQNFFSKTSKGVIFLMWWLSSLGHCTLALAVGSMCPERFVEWVGAALSMIFVFFTFIFSTFDTYTPTLLHWQQEQQPGFAPVAKAIFFLMPCFHFGRMFDIILERVKTKGDAGAKTYKWARLAMRGAKIAYDDTDPNNVKTYRPEGVGYSLWMLLLEDIVYLIVSWYCGQLFSGHDGGMTKPPWFPFTPSYWGIHQKKSVIYEGDVSAQEKQLSEEEESVRVHKLSVSYGKTQALRETTFAFGPGQIWALLGHNGAGKSTLINVLSGMVVPTFGLAFVRGMDVKVEMAHLQRVMGTCPQHDTLFAALTGREHLMVYAHFKGIHGAKARREVQIRLGEVDLLGAADLLAATCKLFSFYS